MPSSSSSPSSSRSFVLQYFLNRTCTKQDLTMAHSNSSAIRATCLFQRKDQVQFFELGTPAAPWGSGVCHWPASTQRRPWPGSSALEALRNLSLSLSPILRDTKSGGSSEQSWLTISARRRPHTTTLHSVWPNTASQRLPVLRTTFGDTKL